MESAQTAQTGISADSPDSAGAPRQLFESSGVKALLEPKGIRSILLVTGALHMGRARSLFERAGFEVIPAPLPDASCESVGPEARLGLTIGLAQEYLARAYNRAAVLAVRPPG